MVLRCRRFNINCKVILINDQLNVLNYYIIPDNSHIKTQKAFCFPGAKNIQSGIFFEKFFLQSIVLFMMIKNV